MASQTMLAGMKFSITGTPNSHASHDQSLCNLLHSYLENRTQKVKIGEVRSSSGVLAKGVPQGSILGPKIFNCFINDLLIELSKVCVPGNYADDNTICCIHKNRHIMLNNLMWP